MSHPFSPPDAGWYPDVHHVNTERWWNGVAWTSTTRSIAPDRVTGLPAGTRQAAFPTAATYGSVQPRGVGHRPVPPAGYPPTYRPAPAAPAVRGMGDAIRAVFSSYATFTGRAGRAEFWYWALFNAVVAFGTLAIATVTFVSVILAGIGAIAYVALIGWTLTVYIPNLAVSVRRLRDAGFHWALIFLGMVPLGSVVLIILWAQPSKPR